MKTVLPTLTSMHGFRVLACEEHGRLGLGCRPGQVVLVDLLEEYVVADVYFRDGVADDAWHDASYFEHEESAAGEGFFLAFEGFRQRCVRRRVFRYSLWAVTQELFADYGVVPKELGVTDDHIRRWLDGYERAGDIVQRLVVHFGLVPLTSTKGQREGHVSLS